MKQELVFTITMSDLTPEFPIHTPKTVEPNKQIELDFADIHNRFVDDLEHGFRTVLGTGSERSIVSKNYLYSQKTGSSYELIRSEVMHPQSELKKESIIRSWHEVKNGKNVAKSITLTVEEKHTKATPDYPQRRSKEVKLEYTRDGRTVPVLGERVATAQELIKDYITAQPDPEKANAAFQKALQEGRNPEWFIDPKGGDD